VPGENRYGPSRPGGGGCRTAAGSAEGPVPGGDRHGQRPGGAVPVSSRRCCQISPFFIVLIGLIKNLDRRILFDTSSYLQS